MVSAHELRVSGELVEPLRQALTQQPAVGEDDGGPVLANELDESGIDGGPDGVLTLGRWGR